MKTSLLFFLVCFLSISLCRSQDINLTGYTMTFDDEFNSLSATTTSPKGGTTWYAAPLNGSGYYSSSTWDISALSTSGGILSDKAFTDGSGNWHSGELLSVDPTATGFSQQYGYFEIRCQMPSSGVGAWPAFWLDTTSGITSQTNEEIDIFEWYGNAYTQNQDYVSQASHNWNPDGSQNQTLPYLAAPTTSMPGGSFPWQGYHIYGCQVDPVHVTWYVDGTQTNQIATPTSYLTSPFFVQLDYALGGGWPLSGMVNNSSFNVDWVRVYSLPSGLAAPTGLTATAGNAQVSLSWTASAGATSYNIYRGTTAGGESGTAVATGVTATSYTDTGRTNGTTYYYKVAAANSSGTSANSGEANATPAMGGTDYALNTTGSGFPTVAASYTYYQDNVWQATDGIISYTPTPDNRWTSYQSGNSSDWLAVTFASSTMVGKVNLDIYSDGGGVTAPASYDVQYWNGSAWVDCANQVKSPTTPTGGVQNTVTFSSVTTTQVRVVFTPQSGSYSGVTEFQVFAGSGGGSAPAAPTGLAATSGNAQLSLSWTASSGATSYNIYRGTMSGGESSTAIASGVTSTSYTDTGLSNGTTYYYKVAAVNAYGTSSLSGEAFAAPAAGGTNYALNTAGSGYPTPSASYTYSSDSIWQAVDGVINYSDSPRDRWTCYQSGNSSDWFAVDFGTTHTIGQVQLAIYSDGGGVLAPTSYDVQYWTGSAWTSCANQVKSPSTPTGGTLNTVSFNAVGTQKVRVVLNNASGAYSGLTEFEVFAASGGSAPAAPTGLAATGGNAQVALNWTASSGATTYNIYRGTTSGGEGSTALATGVTATSYTDTGLTNGTTYYYKVVAVNSFGSSGSSNEANATPSAGTTNYALNTAGSGYPSVSASYTYSQDNVWQAVDGVVSYVNAPRNRWTCYLSGNSSDWLAVDFGSSHTVSTVTIDIYSDGGGVLAPSNYDVQYWNGSAWVDCSSQSKSPSTPTGGTQNTVTFSSVSTQKIRVVFTNASGAYTGVTELGIH